MASFYFSTSGSNTTGDGSIGNPWQNFKGKKNGVGALAPGDICYFKYGDVWTGSNAEVVVESSGLSGNVITLDAYGTPGDGLPTFCGSAITTAGWTYTGANSIYVITGQTQSYIRVVTQDDNKGLGVWYGSLTALPAGTWARSGTSLYVRCWSDADPSTSSVRIGSYAHSSSGDGARGLVSSSRTNGVRGSYVTFNNLKVICANGIGFSASAPYNTFNDCVAMGCGGEGSLFYSELGGSNENADGGRWNRGEVSYCAAEGSGHGQGCSIYCPRVWYVDTYVHDNFMAGIDFLDFGSGSNCTESGALRCTVTDNGRWQDGNSYDPQIYVDGASEIFIYGCVFSGSGTLSGATNARGGLAFGSEHPDTKPCENVWVINCLGYKNHWATITSGNIGGFNNIKNITIVNCTLKAYDSGGYDMVFTFDGRDATVDNWVLRNNIFYADNSATCGDYVPADHAFIDADRNVYYRQGGNTNIWRISNTNKTLAQWRTDTSEDANSVYGDPLLVNASDSAMDAHISPSSPAIDLGMINPYIAPSWLPADLFPYGTGVRGTTLASGVFDNTTASIDAGFHYLSGSADPGLGASTPKGMLLMGCG